MMPRWLQWAATQKLIAAFGEGGLRFVGGAVRDAMLEREVIEVDAATILLPEATMERLQKHGIRAIPTGIAHGTVTAVIDGKSFEITTLRRDVATDGRHARVKYTDDWKEDAKRRDFTMNALYLSPSGELFDYFGGAEDAKAGRVRFIGDAGARVAEDYLRILRFFRFYAWYGKGEPDAEALAACSAGAAKLTTLSGERIQQEMLKLLAAPHASDVLQLMQKSGVLSQILEADASPLPAETSGDPVLRLALLLLATGASGKTLNTIVHTWKLSNALVRQLQLLLVAHDLISPELPLPEQKKLLRHFGAEIFARAVAIRAAQSDSLAAFDAMRDLPQRWQPPVFPVTGDDLILRGFAPGKALGAALRVLEEKWESSDYMLTKEELLSNVK